MNRKFGLIGKPLSHSWSKDYFQQKFRIEGITGCTYENFQLDDLSGLRDLAVKEESLEGFNVTAPFKVAVLDMLDETDPLAEITRAVNCVKIYISGNSIHLKGYNTDTIAFKKTLEPVLKIGDRKALVLGTGGAASSVCHALQQLNIEYTLVSRERNPGILQYDELSPIITGSYQLIINATPVGMYPDVINCPPIPYKYLSNDHLLYDLVYNPAETLFLRNGKKMGARTKNGLEMLHLQAELSWEIWNK